MFLQYKSFISGKKDFLKNFSCYFSLKRIPKHQEKIIETT